MATRRRPRTKVYDCNFNLGESYYKPVMDSLDRKYSGRPEAVTPIADRESTPSNRASRLFGDAEAAPSRASRLLADFESNGIESHKPSRQQLLDDDDAAIDAEFDATMKRIKAARAARNTELDEEFGSFTTKKKINLTDQLLDSVGLNSKTQRAIEDDVLYKQKSSAKKFFDEDDEKVLAKWTAVRPGAKALIEAESAADEANSGAVSRARKSKARIQDIDTELEELAARGAARQKRITDLKAFLDESSDSSSQATVKVSKRISVKSTTEKKQVSF